MIDPLDPLILELRKVVQKIALMSHAPIQGYNFAPSEVGRGERWRVRDTRTPIAHLGQHSGKSGDTLIPRGDIPRHDDREADYRQKSHVYFQKGLDRLIARECSRGELETLLGEARETLEDWRKTPAVAGVEPERGSFFWRCAIADDTRDLETIKRTYMVSRATIYRYRAKYRGLRAVPSASTATVSSSSSLQNCAQDDQPGRER